MKLKKLNSKILKTIFIILLFFVMNGCNQKSKKGNWSRAEFNKCIIGAKSKTDQDFQNMLDEYGIKLDDVVSCACEEFEKKYESFEELKKNMENDFTEIEGIKLILSCLGDEDFVLKVIRELFIAKCIEINDDPSVDIFDYCTCMTDKAIEEFKSPYELFSSANIEWQKENASYCLGNYEQLSGWTEKQKESWMSKCILDGENDSSITLEYCNCMMDRFLKDFPTPKDTINCDYDWVLKNGRDCGYK